MMDDDRVMEWEEGLPSPEELTPLSQSLISPELACAFSIREEPLGSFGDVQRASYSTVASLRRTSSLPVKASASFEVGDQHGTSPVSVQGIEGCQGGGGGSVGGDGLPIRPVCTGAEQNVGLRTPPVQAQGISVSGFSPNSGHLRNSPAYASDVQGSSPVVLNGLQYASSSAYDRGPEINSCLVAGDSVARKSRKPNESETEDADSVSVPENSNEEQPARTLKRPRLVWTPQLHKRFVDAVAHLGIKNAVPKTIMQLMNVEGLTRENVASHLQKYRLYLKRMQGLSNDGPSASDQLFASTPVPLSLAASAHFLTGNRADVLPIPFAGSIVPVPVAGFSHGSIPGHMNAAGHFLGYDPHSFGAFGRTLPPRLVPGNQIDLVGDNQSQPGSPPPRILTLFPTSH